MPVLFRCFQCQQVLRTGRSKIGSVITCPKCGMELIVPDVAGQAPKSDEGRTTEMPSPAFTTKPRDSIDEIRPEDIRVQPDVVPRRSAAPRTSATSPEPSSRAEPLGAITGADYAYRPEPPPVEPEFPPIDVKPE